MPFVSGSMGLKLLAAGAVIWGLPTVLGVVGAVGLLGGFGSALGVIGAVAMVVGGVSIVAAR